jgi:hypothetical protein
MAIDLVRKFMANVCHHLRSRSAVFDKINSNLPQRLAVKPRHDQSRVIAPRIPCGVPRRVRIQFDF